MWSRSSPTRQFPFRAVSTSTRCPSACRSPAVFAATASFWTRPRRWNRPLPTSQGSDARAPTLASSPGLRSTSNRLRPTRPYRPRPLNADFRWSSSPASSELDLNPLALVRARCVSTGALQRASTIKLLKRLRGYEGKTSLLASSPRARALIGKQVDGRRAVERVTSERNLATAPPCRNLLRQPG